MLSLRNSPAPVPERYAPLLDAARDAVLRDGLGRVTAQRIADGAGVSRQTVYRAFGSVENAIMLALTREFGQGVDRILAALPAGPGAQRLAAFLGGAVRELVDSELVAAVRRDDPNLLTPYLTARLGRSQEAVLGALAALLAEGRADGSIRAEGVSAVGLLLQVQGVALGGPMLRAAGEFDGAVAQLVAMTASFLAAAPAGAPRPAPAG